MPAVCCTMLLAGCATLPERLPIAPISSSESYASAQSLAAPAAEWPADGWWHQFSDPQLSRLIEEGLSGASDLRIAQARFARAEALVRQSRSRLLPSLNADAQGGVTKQSYNYIVPGDFAPRGWPDYGQATLSLDWEIDFWGRNRAALAAARSESEAAGVEAQAARLTVATAIAAAYADLAGLHAEFDAAQEAVAVRSRTLELMRGRAGQGLENQGAVERAASALASAEGERAALDEALALSRHRIAALMGAGPDRGLAIARPALDLGGDFGLPANLPAELIGRRPDIVAARLRSEAAASRISEARAAFYPNVNLRGLVGLQALGIGDVFKSGSDFGTAGPAISLPIFDGGRLRSRHRAAEADYALAVAQYDGALTQALREVADAAASERALAERLDRARAAQRAASSAWTVANNRYRGGLATYLDVLSAEDALIGARRGVAALQTRAFALDVALIRALGGGFRS
ncbi:efflux transporter outer membrane subunit [Sphingomonas sp. IC081]|uniref:efflux transporter outer membrane subunit n=2 Tax=Sphingomonadaceae TaxID=41297 RepID=UPI001157038F|nr:efflux transporter outer membrane subunit [Sphingomonas sp. IC081]QDK35726.1 multidrug transporter [Sphingomonas sp. IC081]QSR20487.1 multidrug transporter [Novosphingobium sp. KA1]